MFGNCGRTQARREAPVLRLAIVEWITPLTVRGRTAYRGGVTPIPGPSYPGRDPAGRHSARLAMAA